MGYAKILTEFTNRVSLINNTQDIQNTYYLELTTQDLIFHSNILKPTSIREIYRKLLMRITNINQELLLKAIYTKNKKILNILDITAGFGKDASIMAHRGHHVTMCEHHPITATILYYASINNLIPNTCKVIYVKDSFDFITSLPEGNLYDVIYFDPMFEDHKTAKSKKDMQIIQLLTSNMMSNYSNQDILAIAKQKVKKVVVKRDNKHTQVLYNDPPVKMITGTTVRFDIY